MGVYIRGMSMPQTCSQCPMMEYRGDHKRPFCKLEQERIKDEFADKPEWCNRIIDIFVKEVGNDNQ